MSTLSDISNAAGIISGSEFQSRGDGICLGHLEPFEKDRVHEIEGSSARALALSLAGKSPGLSFWVATDSKTRSLRARAVRKFLDPSHIVCVEVANRSESLWAGEEALRCRGAGIVVIQMSTGPDLLESRRLQIAAQAGGTIGLVIIERWAQSSAAQTRWQCKPGNSSDEDWVWSLTKNKQGRLGGWSVRGDPDPALTTPPDLLPLNLLPRPDNDHFRLTTMPRPLVSPAPARPMESA